MSAIDVDVVVSRLTLMRDLLGYLAGVADVSGSDLAADLERRLAVERALCQLVDQAVDINAHLATRVLGRPPQTQRESFDLAARAGFLSSALARRLGPSTGMRNLLVHDYADVDLDRVAASVPLAVQEYGDYVREVARVLRSAADTR